MIQPAGAAAPEQVDATLTLARCAELLNVRVVEDVLKKHFALPLEDSRV